MVVGLTGGIGSGKSTVASMLGERGAVVIDTDDVARDVVAPGAPAHDAVLERFGTLDRPRLADIVFSDAKALADLNAIVHPAIRSAVVDRLKDEALADQVVVLVVPLLVESKLPYPMAAVIVVDCQEAVADRRLLRQRAMSPSDIDRRRAAQATRAQRLAAADLVIVNDGSIQDLASQVDDAWNWIRAL